MAFPQKIPEMALKDKAHCYCREQWSLSRVISWLVAIVPFVDHRSLVGP